MQLLGRCARSAQCGVVACSSSAASYISCSWARSLCDSGPGNCVAQEASGSPRNYVDHWTRSWCVLVRTIMWCKRALVESCVQQQSEQTTWLMRLVVFVECALQQSEHFRGSGSSLVVPRALQQPRQHVARSAQCVVVACSGSPASCAVIYDIDLPRPSCACSMVVRGVARCRR